MPTPTRLNKKIIDSLPPPAQSAKRGYVIRDTSVRGLILSVNKQSKSWKVQRDLYRNGKLVRTVQVSIGSWPDVDVDGARTAANEVIALIKSGVDPNAPQEQPQTSVLSWTVEQLYDEYMRDMEKRDCRDISVADVKYRLDTYLADWKPRLITSLTKAECRARHTKITADVAKQTKWATGKRTANLAMKQLKWALNFAAAMCEDHETLPTNPVSAVTMHKERAANRALVLNELPEWWGKVQLLPNPLRRQMHILNLLSALRPGTLVAIRREWIDLDARKISIPRTHMKSDEPFELPLSQYMCDVVKTALSIGDVLYGKSDWLFPTRSKDGQRVIASKVWKEGSLPSETGHILRHTYRTIAETTTVPVPHRRMLLNHALEGMDAIYVDKRQLFDDLLKSQELMTARILELCKATPAVHAEPDAGATQLAA